MTRSQCSQLWLVDAIRDGRVGGTERASFERHQFNCSDCTAQSQRAQALQKKLTELPSGLPDAFTLRRQRRALLGALDASFIAPTRAFLRRGAWLAAALAGVIICVIGMWDFRRAHARATWVVVATEPGAEWSEYKSKDVDHLVLENGRFRLSIRRPSASSRVLLLLPDGVIEDLGTELEVWIESGHTSHVAVWSGEIILRVQGAGELRLRAGDRWDRTASGSLVLSPRSEAEPDGSQTVRAERPQEKVDGSARMDPKMPRAVPRDMKRKRTSEKSPTARARTPDTDGEDAAYLRVIGLLAEQGRRNDARNAVEEYLDRYPHGFRRLEVIDIGQRLQQ